MNKCNYIESYPDIETEKGVIFDCEEDAYKDGKCKFHLKGYLNENTKNEIQKLFSEKIKNIKKGEILKCVGYTIPSIQLLKDECESSEVPISIIFAHATFTEIIDFSSIKFLENISFHNTTFKQTVKIRNSIFKNSVDFSFSKFFGDNNSFSSTKFEKKLQFSNANPLNDMDFEWVHFHIADFVNCEFSEEAKFNNTVFENDVRFINSNFEKASFSEAIFKEIGDFQGAKFLKIGNFSKIKLLQSINGEIRFNGNMANVSFLDTDIKNIKFGNETSWKIIDNSNKNKKNVNKDFKIYEERQIEKNQETKINLESIKNIYRDLRENFELNLQYEIAGEFFVREMEISRKYTKKNNEFITKKKHPIKQYFSFYWIYNIIAQYGQSYYRPIYFAIPIIAIGTCFFRITCLNEPLSDSTCEDTIVYPFIRSLSAFIPFFTFVNDPSIVDYALRLALLPISGAFFISLKRKFERKLRH